MDPDLEDFEFIMVIRRADGCIEVDCDVDDDTAIALLTRALHLLANVVEEEEVDDG